ncbi:MAG: hypothetical protein ACK5U7_16260 [Bacteroidota bacterium]
MKFNRHPLLSPDDAGAAGAKSPIPPAPGSDAIPLPRAEYEKLVAARTELDQIKPRIQEAETIKGSFQTLFSKDASPEAKANIVAAQMKAAGYTDAEIKAHLSGEPEEEPEQPRRGRDGRGEPDPTDDLRKEMNEMSMAMRRQALESAKEALDTSIQSTLDEASDLQSALKKMSEVDEEGAATAKELVPTISAEAHSAAIAALKAKREKGVTLTRDEMRKTAREATAATIKKYQRIIGQASRIGKAPQMDDYAELAKSTPVATPTVRPNAQRADVERDLEAWSVDKLLREATSLDSPGRV